MKNTLIGLILAIGIFACPFVARAGDQPPAQIFDIPKLSGIIIDGDPTDWGATGLRLDALAPINGHVPAASEYEATVRLGWDDRGLLCLATIHSGTPIEAKGDDLWTGESVELFLATRWGSHDLIQADISPGITAAHPKLRIFMSEHRYTVALAKIKTSIIAASKISGDRYYVECLIPWDQLGIEPKPDREIAFQIMLNHLHGGTAKWQLVWNPALDAFNNTRSLMRLRLADQPSPPVDLAAAGDYERFRRLRLGVNASENLAGKSFEVRNGKDLLASGKLTLDGNHATANLVLAMPPAGTTFEQIRLILPGHDPIVPFIPDAREARLIAFQEAQLKFSAYVFDTPTFPTVDFEQSSLAEDLIGQYALTTDYYDANFNHVTEADSVGRYGCVVTIAGESNFVDHRFITLYRESKSWRRWGSAPLNITASLPAELNLDPVVLSEQHLYLQEYLSSLLLERAAHTDPATAILFAGLHEMKPGFGPVPHRLDPASMNDDWWYALRRKIGLMNRYPYIVITPPDYDKDSAKRWPLMIFLHGVGDHATDWLKIRAEGAKRIGLDQPPQLPFVIISLETFGHEWWNPRRVMDCVDDAMAKYRVDPDHVYLTGTSMGGFGTWETAIRYPDRFAAIVPMAGGADPDNADVLKYLPIWIFHGAHDRTVPLQMDQRIAAALKAEGANFKFTIEPNAEHDCWTDAYNKPELYEWMLKQSRGKSN